MKEITEIWNEYQVNRVAPSASKVKYYKDTLFGAIIDNNFDLVKWTLENGASLLFSINYKGETFLMQAIDNDCSLEIITILLKYTKNIDARDIDGETALMIASYYHRESVVDILLKNGADTSWINGRGYTALLIACKHSKYEIAKLLIEAGANVNVRNRDGLTPLLLAIHRHNFRLAELLVKNGADVNLKDNTNKTPLMVAVFQKQYDIVKLLVENGADVNIKNDDGETALYYAKSNLELNVKNGIPANFFNEIYKKIIDCLEKNADATNCNGE